MKVVLPEKYEEIAKRLNLALTDEQVRNGMLAQEELINEFADNKKAIEKERQLKEEAIENGKREVRLKIRAIRNLKSKGMSISEIAAVYDLSEAEINELICE